jgi:lysophospholipase L1-like esterase
MAPALDVAPYPDRLAALVGGRWQITAIIRSGSTVEEMEPEVLDAMRARPDALVVQVGINECAPRPLGVTGRARLGRLRPQWMRERIIGLIHRWRPEIIRLRPLAQFTTADRFEASVSRIVRAARDAGVAVLLLPITHVTAVAELRTPFTNREVERYNGALQAAARDGSVWVNVAALFPGMTPDDYCHAPETVHWSGGAHQRAAEYIAAWLGSLS